MLTHPQLLLINFKQYVMITDCIFFLLTLTSFGMRLQWVIDCKILIYLFNDFNLLWYEMVLWLVTLSCLTTTNRFKSLFYHDNFDFHIVKYMYPKKINW
jgi:hypothetical protein